MAKTQERPDRKEMRKLAKDLSIDGWEQMTGDAMWAAILKAQKKTTGKAASKTEAKTNGHGTVKKVERGKTKADKGEPVTPSQKAKASKTKDKPAKEAKKPKNKPAKSGKTKKAAASKPGAKETPVAENGNPFRPGSNAFLMTELFLKGGLRSKMIDTLIKKIEFHPWAKKAKTIDPRHEMDKRMLMATHQLQHKYGFTVIQYGGRGPEKGGIKVFAPGEAVPADWKAKAISINGERVGAEKPAKAKTTKKAEVKGKSVRKSTKPAKTKTTEKPAGKAKKAAKPKAETTKPKTAGKAQKATTSKTKAKAKK